MSRKTKKKQMELLKPERVQKTAEADKTDIITRYRLALVREEDTPYEDVSLTHPKAVAEFLNGQLHDRPQEAMCAVYLDTRNRLIAWQIAYLGTLNRAAVEPRALLQMALLTNAAGIILAHNHPSGDPSPSAEDLAFTRRMAEAGEVVGVRLIDHLILGDGSRWVSLRQRGAW